MIHRISHRTLLVLVLSAFLAACATHAERYGFSKSQWQALAAGERKAIKKDYKHLRKEALTEPVAQAGPEIAVMVSEGTAAMPPFEARFTYIPIHFQLFPGHCRKILLNALDHHHDTVLGACYDGKILTIDPSRYDAHKSHGSLFLNYNPLWQQGFLYSHVNTSGYVRLHNANVVVSVLK